MPDFAIVWNVILTGLFASVVYFVKAKFAEVDTLSTLLNRTREEIARDKATHEDLERLAKRMETAVFRLEDKIDKFVLNGGIHGQR